MEYKLGAVFIILIEANGKNQFNRDYFKIQLARIFTDLSGNTYIQQTFIQYLFCATILNFSD